MLRINRVRIEIQTDDGLYGFDESFSSGLNIIASDDNTRGKSSIISIIFYCLGCEELLGGQGAKVLTPAFQDQLENDNGDLFNVIQSCAYLEIFNGTETITLYRTIKNEKRESKLITVYHSNYCNISNTQTLRKDYYVQLKNAATSNVGFHKFLGEYLSLNLPIVYDYNDNEHLLYIQQIVAALFIEQKGGWSDLLYRVPYFGIPGVKKRVIEYWLNIKENENEHTKRKLAREMRDVETEWKFAVKELVNKINRFDANLINISNFPEILTEEQIKEINITIKDVSIDNYTKQLIEKLEKLQDLKPKIEENFENLQQELKITEEKTQNLKSELNELYDRKKYEYQNIRKQKHNLEQIENDIQNNNDAKKLKQLGADINLNFAKDICPVCKQHISDVLLPFETPVMSIEDNIKHLKAQRDMLTFSIDSHTKKINKIDIVIKNNENVLSELEKIAFSLRSDIMATNNSYSETVIRKKVMLQDKIEELKQLQNNLSEFKISMQNLSETWKGLLIKKKDIDDLDSDNIEEKLGYLLQNFTDYLFKFNFSSISEKQKNRIKISSDTLLPIIDEFDMKFSTSASDNIRMIWAYTLSLLLASNEYSTSKLNLAIFDEPKQQSAVDNDFRLFIDQTLEICKSKTFQIILGVTAKDDTDYISKDISEQGGNIINVVGKAFRKMQ